MSDSHPGWLSSSIMAFISAWLNQWPACAVG
ncbi:MAG: hypothetical protein JWP14_393 [Frankiales bacterium]|nr:hypothetical protein [Frankiales bacterium]